MLLWYFLGAGTFEIYEIDNNFDDKYKMCLIAESHISIQSTNTYSNTQVFQTWYLSLCMSISWLYQLLR